MFNYHSFIVRWLVALFFVFGTYNPSGYSYVHWLVGNSGEPWSLKILVGIVLFSVMVSFALATVRTLGRLGIAASAGLFIAATWTLIDLGVLRDLTEGAYLTISLVVLASILAVGLSWSHVTMQVTGQVDSNDITLR